MKLPSSTILFAAAFSVLAGPTLAETTEITLLLVNDFDRMEADSAGRGGFAQVMGAVNSEMETREHVLLFHAGDAISPSLMSSFDQGAHIIDLLNAMPVVAFTPGNHEFDFGPEVAAERFSEAAFPIVASNLFGPDGSQFVNTQPTLTLDVDGVTIGVLGLLTPDTHRLANTGDTLIADPLDIVNEAATQLRESGADLVVALTHTGLQEDLGLMRSGAADIILSGHDHLLTAVYDGRTALVESREQGEYVAAIDLSLDRDAEGSLRWRPQFRTLNTADFQPDPDLAEAVVRYLDALSTDLDVEIGRTDTALDSRRAAVRGEETAIGNLVADAMRAATNADVAIINGGSIRGDRQYPAGAVLTRRHVQEELPFGNRTVLLKASGETILAALEIGFGQAELRGGGFPQVSGMTITLDPSAPPGSRVQEVFIGEHALELEALYRVATSDFLAMGGDGYEPFTRAQILVDPLAAQITANQVSGFIEAAGVVAPMVEGRLNQL